MKFRATKVTMWYGIEIMISKRRNTRDVRKRRTSLNSRKARATRTAFRVSDVVPLAGSLPRTRGSMSK